MFNKVLDHYGRECFSCHRSDKLCVDHIGGNVPEGKQLKSRELWIWLIRNNFPSGFRILCQYCNLLDGILRKNKYLGIDGIDGLLELKKNAGLGEKNHPLTTHLASDEGWASLKSNLSQPPPV